MLVSVTCQRFLDAAAALEQARDVPAHGFEADPQERGLIQPVIDGVTLLTPVAEDRVACLRDATFTGAQMWNDFRLVTQGAAPHRRHPDQ